MDGGSEDVQKFLSQAYDCNEKDCIFLAICDGDFYKRRDSRTDDKTRIERLERLTNNKTIFVKTIDDLGSFLKGLVN